MFQDFLRDTFNRIFILTILIITNYVGQSLGTRLVPPVVNATFKRLDRGTAKVWGADLCPAKDYPFMVGILKNPNTRRLDITCGGTLVHPRIVLTAASCIEDKVGLKVVLGLWLSEPTIVNVQRIDLHPGWIKQKKKISHNIGLVHLEDEIHGIKLLRIPKRKYHGEMRASCPKTFIVGTGEIEPHRKINILKEGFSCGKLRTIDHDDCFHAFPSLGMPYFKTTVCTYNSNNTMGVFRSDAGSPLICGNFQIGIVSFAIRFKTTLPSVFTRRVFSSKKEHTFVGYNFQGFIDNVTYSFRVDYYTRWLHNKIPIIPSKDISSNENDYDYVQDKSANDFSSKSNPSSYEKYSKTFSQQVEYSSDQEDQEQSQDDRPRAAKDDYLEYPDDSPFNYPIEDDDPADYDIEKTELA